MKLGKYEEFLASKQRTISECGLSNPKASQVLFPFQRAIVELALRRGKCAIFAGTGLGKTAMQVEWGRQVLSHAGGKGLIVAPLAVSQQTIADAKRLLNEDVRWAEGDEDLGNWLSITNYAKLSRFDLTGLTLIIGDETGILKNQDGATRNRLVEDCAEIPFRLACTATPAPNDVPEIGNHAVWLGVGTMAEMLATYFVHDGGETQKWRLKGHARDDFWQWMSEWAICLQHPRDLGFEQAGYDLPPLSLHEIVLPMSGPSDEMFPELETTLTLRERQQARKDSVPQRVEAARQLVKDRERWVLWCNLNAESRALAEAIPHAVEISGDDSDEVKAEAMLGFANGAFKVLITKPSIAGFGMNWQICHKTAFVGLSDSFEQMYQCVRRFWRFGQQHPVDAYVIISDREGAVLANVKRKEAEAEEMYRELSEKTAKWVKKDMREMKKPKQEIKALQHGGKGWSVRLGDCVEVSRQIPDNYLDYTIFSPPFASLYTYSDSERDMGNCTNNEQFFAHYQFLLGELFRATKPGRLVSFHCMNLPSSKSRDGFIGLKDFRGDLIRAMQAAGFYYHSEVVIWKDPVTAMQRTKAIGLLHKQLRKDSALSRQGIPDYLVTMRKPGENTRPVNHYRDEEEAMKANGLNPLRDKLTPELREKIFPIPKWQQYASPVWMDIKASKTLQKQSARADADEKHICPLQLEVIERAIELWTNRGDRVFSPFMGIGSEGYVAVKMGRSFLGIELKESYYLQAVANIREAEMEPASERELNELLPDVGNKAI